MIEPIPPAAIFILGALLIPLLKGRVKSAFMLMLPVFGFINLISIPLGTHCVVNFMDFEFVLLKVDRLSLIFGYIFHIITLVTVIYILNVKKNLEYVAGFVYAGSALGVVFSGDMLSFFVFWELLTVGSMFLILARRTKASMAAGFRYALVHVFGGLVLLAGIVMYVIEHDSTRFGYIGLNGLSTYFIFFGIGVNCAWPMLHSWLPDAYPEATIGGAVFLSAFTTKTAVYVLARTFPGTESLIWIGATMTAFPIFYAVIENDLRRVLSYSLINQVGFMLVGIGIGTELSINGATAHAFVHIIYKSLFFMSMGAVIHRTGKINATDLGGLYKSMPLTAIFCIIGAASTSAFPLFSGFVSKSMIISAAAGNHMTIVWLVLLFASAGVFLHSAIKVPFFAFFSHDAGHRVKEAPLNMLIAMGIAAFLCIFIGVYPHLLYSILPYEVAYEPYTVPHVVAQTQLLFFSALAFTLLLLAGIYPAEIRAINLDLDWFYRKGGRIFYSAMNKGLNGLNNAADKVFVQGITGSISRFFRNAPASLMLLIFMPYWSIIGLDAARKAARKEKLYRSFSSGTLSVGLISISVTLYLCILFFV